MLIKEYRVVNNCTCDEYQVAQLYAVAEASKAETGGGEGVEVIKNEQYDDEKGRGQYTYKIYHLSSKVPAFIRVLAPSGALELYEEAWNAYPHCKTEINPKLLKLFSIISNKLFQINCLFQIIQFYPNYPNYSNCQNGYMKENFKLITESMHVDNSRGEIENALNIPPDLLEKRQTILIDIANDPIEPKYYNEKEDPKLCHSKKTGRGPLLEKNWIQTVEPVMTCYKLVTVEFKWFGLQNKIEALIQNIMQTLFTRFHRQLFCWTDRWYVENNIDTSSKSCD
ncbi:6955_t:CDS:2 [Diversispora eburnea]|uniref:6955_t:CDS:1 n=1 Tax=Diversispora eburnea TaxID=1213867 RepID=A0A9N8V5V7_9GLOM|nr:6955_t:CDS:2 [Diversispora eburnea]